MSTSHPSAGNLHLAHIALKQYMKQHSFTNIWEIADHNDIMKSVAIKGDLPTFLNLITLFDILYTDREGQPRPTAALYHAARYGQWELIKAVADPDVENSLVQLDLYDILRGAIKGGQLELITKGIKDERLSRYFLAVDMEVLERMLKYARAEIFEFYLRVLDYNNEFRPLLRKLVGVITRLESVEGVLILQMFKQPCCPKQSPMACDDCKMLLSQYLNYHMDTDMSIPQIMDIWSCKRNTKAAELLNANLHAHIDEPLFRAD